MQLVYNGKYLEYFEVGRTELMRQLGFEYRRLEDHGFMLPVLEAYVKYGVGARYDDLLIIETFMTEIPTLKMKIQYKISVDGKPNEIVAQGYTLHVFVNSETMKPVRVPDLFTNIVRPYYEHSSE